MASHGGHSRGTPKSDTIHPAVYQGIGSKTETIHSPFRVLFVCVENSNRSQMAQAFARMYGAGRVEAYSAGSRPSGRVNPRAIAFMREVGYDLSHHSSKSLAEI